MYFRTSAGGTVRLHDCICWRHLEGRPCRTNQECQVAESTDVVIIPVPPSGCRNSKRTRKGCDTQVPCSATSSNAPPSGAGAAASPNVDHDALLRYCAAVRAALEAGGLRTTVDDCPRQTPGSKYHVWENRGVGMRVEVGAREAVSGTTCLAIHPRLTHLMPLATRAIDLAAAPLPPDPTAAGEDVDGPVGMRQRPAKGSSGVMEVAVLTASNGGGGGRGSGGAGTSLRLTGLSLAALVAACRAVAGQNQSAAAVTVVTATNSLATFATAHVAHGSCSGISPSGAAATESAAAARSKWCRKLHLWPEQVAAWGSTESAIAVLMAELAEAAATTAADRAGTGGTAAKGNRRADGSAGGRPCVAHLRHLLQLGRPCYCGRGHYSLPELQQEVDKRFQEYNHSSRDELQQPQHIMTWIAPAPPPTVAGSKARVQQGCFETTARSACGTQHKQQDSETLRPASQRGGPRICGVLSTSSETAAPETAAVAAMAEYGGPGFDSGGEDFDGSGGGNSSKSAGDRVVLLVGNIPSAVKASTVQTALAEAFAPFGCCGVAVSRTRSGGSHGWSRVTLAVEDSTETAAAAAIAALDNKLHLGGAPLTVSYSSGRLDTIFPYLPYVVRSALRVDSTAAYSATDQATADKMTDLLAGLAERLLLTDWWPSSQGGHGPPSDEPRAAAVPRAVAEPGVAAAASTFSLGPPQPAARPSSLLLPLVLTDGTACCGGNSLSFSRRFQRVVAVELDPDRAEDLRHNAALVCAWNALRRGQLASAATPPGGSSLDTSVPIAPFSAEPNGVTGESPDGSDPRRAMGSEPTSFVSGADVMTRGLPITTWRSNDEGPLGTLEVRCGDYTELMGLLRQDVVFMDPPWGGPQYSSSARNAVRQAGQVGCGDSSGLSTVSVAIQNDSNDNGNGGGKVEYGDTAFTLGSRPLSYMVTELLVSGGARMVALKLPSRSGAELRKMQVRIRQLVTARLRESGNSDGDGAGGACGICPRLLGAEVTLGRSTLVVFLLLPYRRCRDGAEGVGTAAAAGTAESCKGASGLVSAFRTAMRELCSQMGLAYRLVNE
ncbi:hypothetical protein Vretimale_5351 [Volvox reticuliferus]|uniref:Uncharacterized protein n=1 Tax=Volvox reticuliferus TaxID=1737510 RepID=A0A8J4G560_9CHLO|nr:hypothetical protein Vretifemale_3895 [Volvox reticuliferus]GIM00188.1 hypothetical protein Vretimale_5351 [Volvox reticuliferus]